MKKWSKIIVFLVLGLIPQMSHAQLIKRDILALYDPRVEETPRESMTHLVAEMPMNRVGLKVTYHSLLEPLPNDQAMEKFRGIFMWMPENGNARDDTQMCQWLHKQIKKGVLFVNFGEGSFLGLPEGPPNKTCVAMLKEWGVQHRGQHTDNPLLLDTVYKNSEMMDFERQFFLSHGMEFSHLKAIDPKKEIFLKISKRQKKPLVSDFIFTTSKGGFVFPNYALVENTSIEKRHWLIDPFLFFSKAFQTQGIPKPDVTSINGTRIFYSHIDGDGIFNLSHIDRKSFSGEIIAKEIIDRYQSIPITVSLITGYMDQPEYVSDRTKKLITIYLPPLMLNQLPMAMLTL